MRIAIPVADGRLAMHFGHCEKFALLDVDTDEKKIIKKEEIDAPPHEPGLLPRGQRRIVKENLHPAVPIQWFPAVPLRDEATLGEGGG